jgi:hypothetical protein
MQENDNGHARSDAREPDPLVPLGYAQVPGRSATQERSPFQRRYGLRYANIPRRLRDYSHTAVTRSPSRTVIPYRLVSLHR